MIDAEIDDVVAQRRLPGKSRLVAIDGPGGSGKTTFANRLSLAANGAPIVYTDDFASADNPINWWPRMLDQVMAPLARGERSHYQRYDWPSETLAEWHELVKGTRTFLLALVVCPPALLAAGASGDRGSGDDGFL